MRIEISDQYHFSSLDLQEKNELKALIFPVVEEILDKLGISRSAYLMGGESNSAQLCIDIDGDFWSVFTSEKGERFNPGFFFDPWSAANYFIWELMRKNRDSFSNHPFIPFKF